MDMQRRKMTYNITETFVLTNETIVRDATPDEIADIKAREKKWLQIQTEIETKAQAKEAARQAVADRLGLTADEAKLLLG